MVADLWTAFIVVSLAAAAIGAIAEHVYDLWRLDHPHHKKGRR